LVSFADALNFAGLRLIHSDAWVQDALATFVDQSISVSSGIFRRPGFIVPVCSAPHSTRTKATLASRKQGCGRLAAIRRVDA